MLDNYIAFFLGTWIISQSIKFLAKLLGKQIAIKDFLNSYLYYSGPPSSHTALLVMTLLFVHSRSLENQLTLVPFICFTIIWLFEMYMQRKRFVLLAQALSKFAIKDQFDTNWAKKNARISWS